MSVRPCAQQPPAPCSAGPTSAGVAVCCPALLPGSAALPFTTPAVHLATVRVIAITSCTIRAVTFALLSHDPVLYMAVEACMQGWDQWAQQGMWSMTANKATGGYLRFIISQAGSELREGGGQQRSQPGLPGQQRTEQAAQGVRHCVVGQGHAALK